VFQEWNQRRGDGYQLLGRNVHVIHPRGFDINEVGPGAANDPVGREFALVVNRRVRLRDNELLLAVGGQEINVIGDAPVFDLAIRRFEEAEIVDARERRQ
jgi:hypothetical protein